MVRQAENRVCNPAWTFVSSTITNGKTNLFLCACTVVRARALFTPRKPRLREEKADWGRTTKRGKGLGRPTCGRPEYYVAVKPVWSIEQSVRKKKRTTSYQESSRSQYLNLLFRRSVERRTFESEWISACASLGKRNARESDSLTLSNFSEQLVFFSATVVTIPSRFCCARLKFRC